MHTRSAATYEYPPLRVQEPWVDELEADCDRYLERVETLRSFILPGGSPGAAYLHVARRSSGGPSAAPGRRWSTATSRHREGLGGVNPLTATYLNRLSDLLFILARVANVERGGDVLWQPGGGRAAQPGGAGERAGHQSHDEQAD